MDVYPADIARLVAELETLAPAHHFKIENYRDHKRAVDIYDNPTPNEAIVVVACQPPRPDIDQPEVWRSAAEAVALLEQRRAAWKAQNG